MTVTFKLNETEYEIQVETSSYIPIKIGTSKEGGKRTETILGYFTKLSKAGLRCVREELSSSDDTISLMEYCGRVEALKEAIEEQLKPLDA